MPELAATLKAMYETERRRQKFMAAIQGIDIDEQESVTDEDVTKKVERVSTVEEIQARAIARLTGDRNMAGAISQGFTPDMGVDYKIMEGTELG